MWNYKITDIKWSIDSNSIDNSSVKVFFILFKDGEEYIKLSIDVLVKDFESALTAADRNKLINVKVIEQLQKFIVVAETITLEKIQELIPLSVNTVEEKIMVAEVKA